MKTNKIVKLIASVLIAQSAGLIGSLFTTPNINTWYRMLTKPWFSPPNWVFAPVWTSLFVMMSISLFLIWQREIKSPDKKECLKLFSFQLILNVLWSVIFFGLRSPQWSFVEIILLWLAILACIITFYKHSKAASYLLIPYLAWVSFASILNYAIWQLNK